MCDMLSQNFTLPELKTKPQETYHSFQRHLMVIMGLIRRGKLRPARWPKDFNAPSAYLTCFHTDW
jgi:hypothetical protein